MFRTSGFVPSSHLSEVPLKNWEKKFKDGMMMSCRIMELDPARKSLVLTHKKSLIDAKDAVLRSYENVEAGRIYTGVISKIKEQGMLVRFFQGVHGWVPASEFVQGISLENLYYEGQTVRCKVLRFDKKTQNLQLTLRLIKADVDDKSQVWLDFSAITIICCSFLMYIVSGLPFNASLETSRFDL